MLILELGLEVADCYRIDEFQLAQRNRQVWLASDDSSSPDGDNLATDRTL